VSAVHADHSTEGAFRDLLHGRLSAVLRLGAGLALGLTGVGLVLTAITGQAGPGANIAMPVGELMDVTHLLSVQGLLNLGLLVLLATPVLCVAMAAFSFISRRDWRYGAVSLAVLVLILASLSSSF
jgi:uncharacterized membrane protein